MTAEETMRKLKAILNHYDVDLFHDARGYMGRLWLDGGDIAECNAPTLEQLIAQLHSRSKALSRVI